MHSCKGKCERWRKKNERPLDDKSFPKKPANCSCCGKTPTHLVPFYWKGEEHHKYLCDACTVYAGLRYGF